MRPASLLLRRLAIAGVAVVFCLVLAITAKAAGDPAPAQAQGDIAVIVNGDVAIDSLSVADLRKIVTGDKEFWPSNQRVTIFIRAPIARERDAVVRDLCQMTEAQFRQHWIGKVFRADTASGPKITYSAESTIEQVGRTPGAIGFVQGPVNARTVKVLKVDGRLPGQSGYRLK